MVSHTSTIARSSGEVSIPPNVLGFSIEPLPGSTDNFVMGIDEEPKIPFLAGDASRDFGFIIGPTGKGEFEKASNIKIVFEGIGASPAALIIFTVYTADEEKC